MGALAKRPSLLHVPQPPGCSFTLAPCRCSPPDLTMLLLTQADSNEVCSQVLKLSNSFQGRDVSSLLRGWVWTAHWQETGKLLTCVAAGCIRYFFLSRGVRTPRGGPREDGTTRVRETRQSDV